MTYDAFFSHSNVYKNLVEKIALYLEKVYGLKIWLDKWCLIPGESWIPALEKNLGSANCCVVFIGETDSQSWFQNEVEVALNIQSKNKNYRIIPVLLPNAPNLATNSLLATRTLIDLRYNIEDEEQLQRLMCGIKGIRPREYIEQIVVDSIQEDLEVLQRYSNNGLLEKEIVKEFQSKLLAKKFGL